MTEKSSFNVIPAGLYFYWYESRQLEEHAQYWGQLCGSLHRLAFVREELNTISTISDTAQALERLAYHMENYLIRIYELRERAAKLLQAYAGEGDFGKLKGKRTRKDEVKRILPSDPEVSERYLNLLSALDDDIDLRNQNTHDTFLCLGYSNGYDVFDPQDVLVELKAQPSEHKEFEEKLKEAIEQTTHRYEQKINQILQLTEGLLKQLHFVKSATEKA